MSSKGRNIFRFMVYSPHLIWNICFFISRKEGIFMPNNMPDHPDVPIPADHTGNNNAPNGTEVPCYRGETSRENAPTHIAIAAQPFHL